MKKWILTGGFIVTSLIACIFMRAFFLMDLSRTPLEKELSDPIYLVSYADGPEVFHQNRKMLLYSAVQKGIPYFFNYNKSLLNPQFVEKHKDIFSQKAGAGLWLWKPWIIKDALEKVPENSYVFYCDSGFIIKGDLQPILNLLKTQDMALMFYHDKKQFGTLGQCTKRSALVKTGCDTTECFNASLMWAGALFLKNTPTTRRFINKWLAYCEQADLLSASSRPWEEYPNKRIFHHYDQSLLSITYYHNPQGIALIPETEVALNNILRWHHRHPAEKTQSLFFDYNRLTRVERAIITSFPFRKLAEFFYKTF